MSDILGGRGSAEPGPSWEIRLDTSLAPRMQRNERAIEDMPDQKLIIDLPEPKPACDDCLPHAAMALGSVRGVGTRPARTLVSRLVIQEQMGSWIMYRMDAEGGFVGDTWHPTRDDALKEAKREFGVEVA